MKVTNKIELELPDLTKVTLTEEEAEDLFQQLRSILKKDTIYPLPSITKFPTDSIPYLVPIPIPQTSPTTDFPPYPSYPTITCGGED